MLFQFWSAYVPCGAQDLDAVQIAIEQIDVIKRMINQYSKDLQLATNADGKKTGINFNKKQKFHSLPLQYTIIDFNVLRLVKTY